MQTFTAIVEKDRETDLYVAHIPGIPGAHSQAVTLDELHANMQEVLAMLLEDGQPVPESELRDHPQITQRNTD